MAICPELAQTDESALANLSDETETLKSFTDEVQTSSSFSSSGGRQSSPLTSGSKLEREKQTPSLEQEDKQSELLDFKNYEKKLSKKWINYLKRKDSERHQPDTKLPTEITQVSDEELNALQSYCTMKINLIHHRGDSKKKTSGRHKKLYVGLDAEAAERDALSGTVPNELLNRIYFKNMRTTPKQEAAAKQHISSQCPDCNRKRAELALSAFLKQKKTLLESFLLQEKIDEHLHTKDFLTRIAEAHQDFPRLSDDPRIIWKRLTGKSHIRYSGFERSDTEQKMQRDGNSACHLPFATSQATYSNQTRAGDC
ncbi:PREDICTED: uncharacterized protein C8orf48 homolog [Cercocebus atys]|uniref:uncharacterized protein C8orf48 homolog n=1 Tax=Cercocebus atys TaxID=9531 RepID=UPI0005F4AFEF|nr:PREDICTED: uncharacterized protein C8orf48 homolog [Cercocebus atys]